MSHITTTSALLAGLILAALKAEGATGAAQDVFSARDWPTPVPATPVILLDVPSEHKDSLGRSGGPQFTVTVTQPIVVRVSSKADAGDAGAVAVLAALQILQRQIEVAIINAAPIMKLLQHYPFVDAQIKVSSEAEQSTGELAMRIGMEFYQGPEDFAQPATSALQELAIYTDLVNVFDSAGTYSNPPFPGAVKPAPRSGGPDGRIEGGGLDIELPQ